MQLNYEEKIYRLPHGTMVLRPIPADPKDILSEALHCGISIHPEIIRHPRRIAEYYTTALMQRSLNIATPISYKENGKPFIADGPHISISHGHALGGFVKSDVPVGLDIQYPEEKLRSISRRFGHASELEYAGTLADPLPYLTFLWSAKEALFKIYGEGITFSSQIRVEIPKGEHGTVGAQVERNSQWKQHHVDYRWVSGHIVVIAY